MKITDVLASDAKRERERDGKEERDRGRETKRDDGDGIGGAASATRRPI